MDLPDDISYLIFTYAAEPIYTLPYWVDKSYKDLIYHEAMGNPRAYRWAKKNWAKIIDKSQIIENPHPVVIELVKSSYITQFMLKQMLLNITNYSTHLSKLIDTNPLIPKMLKKINTNTINHFLATCPELNLIKKIMNITTCFNADVLYGNQHDDILRYALSTQISPDDIINSDMITNLAQNPNPTAINYLKTKIDRTSELFSVFIKFLAANPSELALDIIEENENFINWEDNWGITRNPNPRAYALIKKHDKIGQYIAVNPNATEFIRTKLDEFKKSTDFSPDDRYFAFLISCNPKCTDFLDDYIDLFKRMKRLSDINECSALRPVKWLSTHPEYVGYFDPKNSIDILSIASKDIDILQNNYKDRYPRALVKFIRWLNS